MRIFALAALVAVLFVSSPAAALDVEAARLRVEASLSRTWRLAPPPYLEVVLAPRPLMASERGRDPSAYPLGESGRWRVVAPIRVEVLALVLESSGACHFLLLDNFAFPEERKGRIQASPILRSLGLY